MFTGRNKTYCNAFIVSHSADCHARSSIYNKLYPYKRRLLVSPKINTAFLHSDAETVVHQGATETLWEHHVGNRVAKSFFFHSALLLSRDRQQLRQLCRITLSCSLRQSESKRGVRTSASLNQ